MGNERPTLVLISSPDTSPDEAAPPSAATPDADGPAVPADLVAEVAEVRHDPHPELQPESATAVVSDPDDEPADARMEPSDDPEALDGQEPARDATEPAVDETGSGPRADA